MDLLKLIKEKSNYFITSNDDVGISSIVSHIEIAEKHFEGGKAGDDFLFNDVIYRSNQAFEGALKEAYRIIEGVYPNNLSPYKIEKYFEDKAILKERVLKLFTNYRIEWRNESTHNYKMYFSEQEALLAIVSISAFINILLDQMIEKKTYNSEFSKLKVDPLKVNKLYNSENLIEITNSLLLSFASEVPEMHSVKSTARINESELRGALSAYINKFVPEINIFHEYKFESHGNKMPCYIDVLLEFNGERVILELKNPNYNNKETLTRGTEQTLSYLLLSGIKNGALFIPPSNCSVEMIITKSENYVEDEIYTVYQIYPKWQFDNTIK